MRPRLLFLLLISLQPCLLRGQYLFSNLQPKNGLSGKEVTCVYEDSEGFLWFGAVNGLNRYDGSSFRVYNRSGRATNGLTNEIITTVVEYGPGRIWTGTHDGLFCLDKNTGIFTRIPFIDEHRRPFAQIAVEKLLKGPDRRLWIGTKDGLFVYNGKVAMPASLLYPSSAVLQGRLCYSSALLADSIRKGLWIGTPEGLSFLDLAAGVLRNAAHDPRGFPLFDTLPVTALALTPAGDLWYTDNRHKLACYHFATGSLDDIIGINNDPKRSFSFPQNQLFCDSKNRLWIASRSEKTLVREPSGAFIILPDAAPTLFKPGSGVFNDAYEDHSGNIWLATTNGASRMAAQSFLHRILELSTPGNIREPEFYVINSFRKAGNDKWWVCKDDGLYLLDEASGTSRRYTPGADTPLRTNRIFDIEPVGREWWCATRNGIQRFNPATGTFRPFTGYPPGHVIRNRSVMWIRKDCRGNIWFSAWLDAIYRYDPVTGACLRFDGTGNFGDIGPGNSFCFRENADSSIWVSYGGRGIRIFDYATGRFRRPPDSLIADNLRVFSMTPDKEGHLWLATYSRGLLKCDLSGHVVDSINTDNGLQIITVANALADPAGRLWAFTNEGLHYVNPGSRRANRLNIDLNLALNDAGGSMQSDGGYLYLSMFNRLLVIDPSALDRQVAAAPPLITRVSVFEKEVPFSGRSPHLRLAYDQNFCLIEFSSPDHQNLPSLQYAYKLEGFDKDWVYCGRRQTAAYTRLPGGSYRFLVKCMDAGGPWMLSGTPVRISIAYPFWNTWWFLVAMLVAVFLALRWIYLFNQQRTEKRYIAKTIDYFANSVYGENSADEICWDIARNCITQLHFEDCVVYLLDEDRGLLIQKAAYGPKSPKGDEIINPLEIAVGTGIVGTVAATGKPLLIADTTRDPRYIIDDDMRLSELAVPILHDGLVIGVIDSEHPQKGFFTSSHLKTLQTIASISSNKIAEAKAEELARVNEIKLLEINKLLAESQLMALRAQMNPHFVFNCLNSIQECIVTQKYGEASNYLNKFSRLFRMVLNNSGQNLVTIDEEKEVLRLYLELEGMRFDHSIKWNISVDEELEGDEILLPSMLIQPYVENALWHGLMHKDGERRLCISFTSISEDTFRCTIEDNGIGRKKAGEIREQQRRTKRHESKGLRIAQDRLELIRFQGKHASVNIIDKLDAAGEAAGTRVVIELSTFLTLTQ